MKTFARGIIAFVAATFFCQAATALTEEQLAQGCWQTKPKCLKVRKPKLSTRINPDDRYRREETIISARFRNRCGGPIFVRILFGLNDGEFDAKYLFMEDKDQDEISERRMSKGAIESEEREARRIGAYPSWGEGSPPGWFTGEMAYAWIGVPKVPEEVNYVSSHFCETELFEDLEYELGG